MEALLDCRSRSDAVGEGKSMIAELYGSLKEHNLVDQVLKKECTVEAGAGFEEDAEDLSLRELLRGRKRERDGLRDRGRSRLRHRFCEVRRSFRPVRLRW